MANTRKYNIDFLPITISDSSRLVKVESASNGSLTLRPKRQEDDLWKWNSPSSETHHFYGKIPENSAKPYFGAFNEFSGRFFAKKLGINFQPISVINTNTYGTRIGSLIDFDFAFSLQELSYNQSPLAISEEDKIENFISQILLADRDANAGSVLVHSNGADISRIDFEQCFGYNGVVYITDVLNGLGDVSSGPFFPEIRSVISIEKILSMPIMKKIKDINLEGFLYYSEGLIDGLSALWPTAINELLVTRDHIYRCMLYRQQNIENLISKQLKNQGQS